MHSVSEQSSSSTLATQPKVNGPPSKTSGFGDMTGSPVVVSIHEYVGSYPSEVHNKV